MMKTLPRLRCAAVKELFDELWAGAGAPYKCRVTRTLLAAPTAA